MAPIEVTVKLYSSNFVDKLQFNTSQPVKDNRYHSPMHFLNYAFYLKTITTNIKDEQLFMNSHTKS